MELLLEPSVTDTKESEKEENALQSIYESFRLISDNHLTSSTGNYILTNQIETPN